MNPFLNPPASDSQPPTKAHAGSTYYARFGQGEYEVAVDDGPARTFVRLEAFLKPWFDEHAPPVITGATQGRNAFSRYYSEAPIALLELEFTKDHTGRFAALKELLSAAESDEDPKNWFLIRTGGQRGDLPIEEAVPLTIYTNLYAEGTTLILEDIVIVDEETREILEKAVSTGHIRDAEEVDLNSLLGHFAASTIEWAIVYDVGQGNAIGLCNGSGVLGYFDFGGGAGRYKRTFPSSSLSKFCFSQNPPIILSHWDEDHWSSANRDPASLSQNWIAPRQRIGPAQAAMIAKIHGLGTVWFLPSSFTPTRFGQIQLELAKGSGRNNSGIVLTLAELQNGGGQQMLMPGDADYQFIPGPVAGLQYLSVVVPHHGAKLKVTTFPACPGASQSRLVYSVGYLAANPVGKQKPYGHPHKDTIKEHDSAGWRDPGHTPTAPHYSRYTKDRSPSGLGHVLLSWVPRSSAPSLPCGAAYCQLEAQPHQL